MILSVHVSVPHLYDEPTAAVFAVFGALTLEWRPQYAWPRAALVRFNVADDALPNRRTVDICWLYIFQEVVEQ